MFYINIPIAVVVLAATPAADARRHRARRGSIDVLGRDHRHRRYRRRRLRHRPGPRGRLGIGADLAVLAAAVALLGLFVLHSGPPRPTHWSGLSIFRTPNLAAANLAQFLLGAAWIPMWFFLNLYLQQVLGYTAFPSGAALLPMTVLIMIGMVALAPRRSPGSGPRP